MVLRWKLNFSLSNLFEDGNLSNPSQRRYCPELGPLHQGGVVRPAEDGVGGEERGDQQEHGEAQRQAQPHLEDTDY